MREDFPSAQYLDQPFQAAIDYFRGKVDLPTERWDDLIQGMHSRACVVAGATRDSLLADIRAAVDKAIAKGTTLDEFRKDFHEVCGKHGWNPKGGQDWRARTIYRTNLSTAYAAGHYDAMMAASASRPFWRYVESSSAEQRLEHLAFVGVTLPHDDPFWDTHYPPNGWGCKCGVVSHSSEEVEQLKAEGMRLQERDPSAALGTYAWENPRTGEVEQLPRGVQPEWAYNVGQAKWGKRLSEAEFAKWQAAKGDAWERLTLTDWTDFGRPAEIPVDALDVPFGRKAADEAELAAILREVLGGEQRVFSYVREGFRYDLVADAGVLAQHVALERAPYLPALPAVLEDPYEVWGCFYRHRGTGRVVLRQRVIKAFKLGKQRGMYVVGEGGNGVFLGWTVVPVEKINRLKNQRVGRLLYARDE